MPPSRPGTLDDATYADIVALVLEVNGHAAGDTELNPADESMATMIIGSGL